jgi:hypothetical protein
MLEHDPARVRAGIAVVPGAELRASPDAQLASAREERGQADACELRVDEGFDGVAVLAQR